MTTFSERLGFSAPKTDLRDADFPDSLRHGLWDTLRTFCFTDSRIYDVSRDTEFSRAFDDLTWSLWFNFYRESIDTRPYYASDALQDIKRKFYSSRFNEAYDFVEFMADRSVGSSRDGLIQVCNEIFTRERSAFRFAGPILVRVTDENQRIEIASSIEQNKSVAVASHIARAAQLYSQQPNPDYRNSIKEAISAVEAAVAFLTGDKPSGVAKPLRGVIEQ